jgi:hypothetical protein
MRCSGPLLCLLGCLPLAQVIAKPIGTVSSGEMPSYELTTLFLVTKLLTEDIDAEIEDNEDDGDDDYDDDFDPIKERISPYPDIFLDEPGAGETPWEGKKLVGTVLDSSKLTSLRIQSSFPPKTRDTRAHYGPSLWPCSSNKWTSSTSTNISSERLHCRHY